MNLVSLKMTPDEMKKEMTGSMLAEPMDSGDSKEEYPYGTCLCLDESTISKLGLGGVQPGATVRIIAVGAVEMKEVEAGSTQPSRLCVQLTDMAVEQNGSAMDNLFPTMKG